jgi:two-component system NtrC family sensor kinase
MQYQLRVEGVAMTSELSRDVASIEADPHQLQQVVINLLSNARDAIRQQDQAGRIRVRTAATEDGALLEVQDNGPGIPPEQRSRIFDPFYTTKAEGQGTGLGLSIVYGIVSSHGGTIEALAGAGGGACFRIQLPLGASRAQDSAAEATGGSVCAGRPGRILVVDDELPLAQMICEALAQDGHRAESVSDGLEALERLGREPFDLIIADMKMPGMGAEGLYESMRQHRAELCTRLLVTTGDTVSDEPDRFVARTGLELLRKPFDLEQLRRRVRRHMTTAPSE